MAEKKKKLTVKQKRFIEFYNGNGVDAARKAGYKGNDNTLQAVAKENLLKPLIKEAIEKREAKFLNRGIKNREERQKFWSDMMDDAKQDRDKLKASELLGRSNSDFTEKIEHSGDINIEVIDSYKIKDKDGKTEDSSAGEPT